MTLRAFILGHSLEHFESPVDPDRLVQKLHELQMHPPILPDGMQVASVTLEGYELKLLVEYGRKMKLEFVGRVEAKGDTSVLTGRLGPPASELGFWLSTAAGVFLLYAILGEPLSTSVMLGAVAIVLAINRLMPNGAPREAIRSILQDVAIAAV